MGHKKFNKVDVQKEMTLAEIYNYDPNTIKTTKKKVGF